MGLAVWQVENCADMFADGDTIPFISRYRKEKTGGLDDAQVAELKHYIDVYNELDKRKDTIIKTIADNKQVRYFKTGIIRIDIHNPAIRLIQKRAKL